MGKNCDGTPGTISGWRHDIRTHLNVLLGAITMMETGRLTEAQLKEYTEIIRTNVLAMLRIVNCLLDQDEEKDPEYIESAKFVDMQVDGLLLSLVESIKPYAMQHELELLYDIESPLLTRCDWELLERVLYNLLTNAVNATGPRGFVYLSAHKKSEFIQINIADTGCGITKEQQMQINGEGEIQGRGLGLKIAKKLMRMMQGDIVCISKENVGTTFSLRLPAAKYAVDRHPGRQKAREVSNLSVPT